jgi:hypothetical protein
MNSSAMSAWLEDEEDVSQAARALPSVASNSEKAASQVSRPVLPPRSGPLPPRAANTDLIASSPAVAPDMPSCQLPSGASSLQPVAVVGRRSSDDFDMLEDSDDDICSERGRSSSFKKQQPAIAAAYANFDVKPPLPPRVSSDFNEVRQNLPFKTEEPFPED